MKKLDKETLTSRREFLKQTTVKRVLPAVAVYLIGKSTPPLFGQTSGSPFFDRQEPI